MSSVQSDVYVFCKGTANTITNGILICKVKSSRSIQEKIVEIVK